MSDLAKALIIMLILIASMLSLGMALDRALAKPQIVVVYCQPVCQMPAK